ncbi:hypothetical protein Ahu01nite_086400 [Winogradskya humida]|uniref:MFS transporter n=1 Tax=Winogradskya humida TaxID=113566 RepID=A0ABQ4A4I8_9ACTN|nr:hypothetical protein Ahu01nite_086400 [Actinoplanes humidus]
MWGWSRSSSRTRCVNAQYLQDVKGYSTLLTGFAIAPLAVGVGVMAAGGDALAAILAMATIVVVATWRTPAPVALAEVSG